MNVFSYSFNYKKSSKTIKRTSSGPVPSTELFFLIIGALCFHIFFNSSLVHAQSIRFPWPNLWPWPGVSSPSIPRNEKDSGNISGEYKNNFGVRQYTLYKPTNLTTKAPLILVLHGCFQTPDSIAMGTDLNTHADRLGFAVLYPKQTSQDNVWQCWNWFDPKNQEPQNGELSILAEMTQEVVNKYNLDPQRVFAFGISAGGAMVSNLVACYKNIFAGGLVHSGLEYRAARSESEAHKVVKTGSAQSTEEAAQAAFECGVNPNNRAPRMLIFHGKDDQYVNPINSEEVVQQFSLLRNLVNNSSTAPQIVKSRINGKDSAHNADMIDYVWDDQSWIRYISVDGMGHAWSGGKSSVPYMEPRGPDASLIGLQFFDLD